MKAGHYDHLLRTAEDKVKKDNSFVRRNYPVFWIATFIYVAAMIFSFSAEFSHIKIRASEIFNQTIAVSLAIILSLIIEGLKFIGKYAVDDYQAGAHLKPGAEKSMFYTKIILAVIGFGLSIWLSVEGASKVTDFVRKQDAIEKVDLVSVEEIKHEYDNRLGQLQKDRTMYENSTWKGKPTQEGLRGAAKVDQQITDLGNERRAALAKADSTNAALMLEYRVDTDSNKSYAKGFAGIAEIVMIVCIFLIGFFDDGLKEEYTKLVGKPERSTF
jgi:hypothetical protein